MSSSAASTPAPVPISAPPPVIRLDSPSRSPCAAPVPDDSDSDGMTTAAATPQPPTPTIASPSPVFAPRPLRLPHLFRPTPLQRPLVMLDGNEMRTPSPGSSLASPPLRLASSPKIQRSSSASSVARGGSSSDWGLKNLVLSEGKLSVEGSEGPETPSEGEGGVGELQPMQLYSPSKDVLDELFKIIRSNRPQNNPLHLRDFVGGTNHRRQWSDASSKDGRDENTRSPLSNRDSSAFPSSPVSRTIMRNPIIYNSQFGQEKM